MESSTIKSGGVGGAGHAKPWGDKEGSEQDKESLKRIIVAKLQTAGTAGDFCSKMKFLCLVYPGVDEALAETIDSKFYDAYKKWKRVKFHESPEVKVVCFEKRRKNCRNTSTQAGQWVEFWRNHLVDRATPKDLVDVIIANKNKNLGKARKLQEEITKEFRLDNNLRSL